MLKWLFRILLAKKIFDLYKSQRNPNIRADRESDLYATHQDLTDQHGMW